MKAPEGSPPWLAVCTAEENPARWEDARRDPRFRDLWPEYNHHGVDAPRLFGALCPRYAHLQALLIDRRSEQLLGRARTVPFAWDGSMEDLPRGFDALGHRALDGVHPPTALSALAAEVLQGHQGAGLSRLVVTVMADLARAAGYAHLVVPLRPSRKDRYPLIPIEDYVSWQREDGLPFDPWLRVHARMEATMLRAERRSLEITAEVADWESWVGMPLPADGRYVFPGGLAPLVVSRGIGQYFEPNVWMLHRVE